MKFKKYCIDFDHTITINGKFPDCGELRPHADRVIRRLKENDAEICIWTCRTGEHADVAKEFLAKYDIPYDTFNETLPSEALIWGRNGRKVYAECYIDDLSIHAQMNGGIDWLEIEEYIFAEKCNFCGGLGYVLNAWANDRYRCSLCEGKGEI